MRAPTHVLYVTLTPHGFYLANSNNAAGIDFPLVNLSLLQTVLLAIPSAAEVINL